MRLDDVVAATGLTKGALYHHFPNKQALGYAVVDEGQKLVIEPGARIYFHKGSGLWVYQNASIEVGQVGAEPVIFQGDRLESAYAEEPGQWDRIWINEGSSNNQFNNVVIKNAFIGIQVEPLPFGENANSLYLSYRINLLVSLHML